MWCLGFFFRDFLDFDFLKLSYSYKQEWNIAKKWNCWGFLCWVFFCGNPGWISTCAAWWPAAGQVSQSCTVDHRWDTCTDHLTRQTGGNYVCTGCCADPAPLPRRSPCTSGSRWRAWSVRRRRCVVRSSGSRLAPHQTPYIEGRIVIAVNMYNTFSTYKTRKRWTTRQRGKSKTRRKEWGRDKGSREINNPSKRAELEPHDLQPGTTSTVSEWEDQPSPTLRV